MRGWNCRLKVLKEYQQERADDVFVRAHVLELPPGTTDRKQRGKLLGFALMRDGLPGSLKQTVKVVQAGKPSGYSPG